MIIFFSSTSSGWPLLLLGILPVLLDSGFISGLLSFLPVRCPS